MANLKDTTIFGKLVVNDDTEIIGNLKVTIDGTDYFLEDFLKGGKMLKATSNGCSNNVTIPFADKAQISWIRVQTTSTDWDLTLFTDATFTATEFNNMKIVENRTVGNFDVYIDYTFEDTTSNGNVYLNLTDNDGSNTFNVEIVGVELL